MNSRTAAMRIQAALDGPHQTAAEMDAMVASIESMAQSYLAGGGNRNQRVDQLLRALQCPEGVSAQGIATNCVGAARAAGPSLTPFIEALANLLDEPAATPAAPQDQLSRERQRQPLSAPISRPVLPQAAPRAAQPQPRPHGLPYVDPALNLYSPAPPARIQRPGDFQPIKVVVRHMNNTQVHFRLTWNATIDEFKALYERREGVPVAMQRFVYNGGVLQGNWTLTEAGIVDGSVLGFASRMRGD